MSTIEAVPKMELIAANVPTEARTWSRGGAVARKAMQTSNGGTITHVWNITAAAEV
jgi:hypothetical protein